MLADMSALGQKQTYALHKRMSALPPIATAKADIRWFISEAGAVGHHGAMCGDVKRRRDQRSSVNVLPALPKRTF
jgi:hypothetical protein